MACRRGVVDIVNKFLALSINQYQIIKKMCLNLYSLCFNLLFILSSVSYVFGQTDFLSSLVYDATKTYEEGDSVIPSVDLSDQIYTARKSVPLDTPPVDSSGEISNSDYWATSGDYTTDLATENSSALSDVPDDAIVDTQQVENLGTPTEDNQTPSNSPLVNISTNGYSLMGAEKMSAGFIISGNEPMNVYIKAEKSQEANITPLTNPKLEIWNLSRTEMIAENDNWNDHENLSSIQTLDPAYYPIEATDSAVFLSLQPGAYLVDVYGSQGNSGKVLVAVNDVDEQSSSQIINISTNGYAYTGSEKMSAGFIITEAQKVFIKAEKSQEPNITALSDPKLEIWNLARTEKISENDDWADNDNISEIQALPSPYYPIEATDAAVYITLQPGAYIADVYGSKGNSGKAIVAVNKID